jgi:tetratricopeptide (TPR) repeat protein
MQTIKEIENQVKLLINEEKWQNAYHICNDMLRRDPDNRVFSKLKLQIENTVKSNNIKAIKAEIKKLEPLLTEKKFEEYLLKISSLQNYQNDFPEIGRIILKAKRLMDEDILQKKENLYSEEIGKIKAMGEINNFFEVNQKLEQLSKLGIHQKEINETMYSVREKWAKQEIKKNSALINSQKFEETIIFLLKLRKICPEYKKIQNLIDKTKSAYQLYKIDNKKDFIFKTLEEIKTLYITKKYEKAIILCERILEIDPKNLQALEYLRKASEKDERLSSREVEKQIFSKYDSFHETADFQQKNYIRI